jgi:hypothetical protein
MRFAVSNAVSLSCRAGLFAGLFAGSIASILAGCASDAARQGGAARAGAERTGARMLNHAELLRTLRGRTLEGLQSDRGYVRAYCAPDGKVSALVDAADGRKHWSGGNWEVRDDTVCFRWRNREWTSGCASVALTAGGAFALQPVRGGPAINSAKVLDGNPYSLGFN